MRGRHLTEADNESSEHVAVVNEAFVRRFFKDGEDPLDQRFGLDLPEYVNTYRIVGIVRDAKFAGFQLDRPARPMFYVALAQTVDYAHPLMKRLELQSHFVRGLLLVTDLPPAALEPEVRRALAAVDPNLTITSVRDAAAAGGSIRSINSARWRAWRDSSASSRWCSRRSVSTA